MAQKWSSNPARAISLPSPGTVTFTPDDQTLDADVAFDTPGQYIMYLTETNDSCNTQVMDSIIVDYEELTMTVSNDTIVCENGQAVMIANATGSPSFEYNWSHTTDLSGVQVINPTSQDDYTVFAESALGCTTAIETINVDVLPEITLTSSGSQTICPGENINISSTATGGNGGPYTFTWTDDNGNVVGTNNVVNVSPTATTVYTITVEDDCESTVKTSTSEVVVAEIPEIEFDVVDGEICTPASFVLFSDTDPSLVYETYWNISDGQTFIGNDTIEVQMTTPGSYDVEVVIVTNDGCVDSLTIQNMLTVYPKPTAGFNFYPSPATILNPEVNFTNGSTNADTYEWTFEEANPGFSTLEDPMTKFPDGKSGTYEVQLIAISSFGCRDTTSRLVTVIPEVVIFAPNSFTPDNDEINPTWKPIINGIDKFNVTVEIYNRWGEKIWESHDLDYGWDGTYGYSGRTVKTGAYVWKVRATNLINDDKYEWDGVVNVLK